MKIGILSMQRIKNSGSFLQGYALKKEIEALGHDVVWVDFPMSYPLAEQKKFKLIRKILGPCKRKAVHMIRFMTKPDYRCRFRIQKFINTYRNQFVSQYYYDLGMTDEYQYSPEIDLLVVGSDEVFNIVQFIEDYKCEIPWVLYGEGFEHIKKISYAASCGNTTLSNLKKYDLYDKSKKLLSDFSEISVRDQNTKQILNDMEISVQMHIDPVLLYNFPEVNSVKITEHNYIIVYGYNFRFSDEEKKAIRTFADSKGKKLICINEQQDFCDKNIVVHPLEMLAYFKNADYVITDTFHGAVISMKYHKTFGAFIRESNKQKLGYLLEHFEMSSRSIKATEKLNKIMNTPADYKRFDEILVNEQKRSHSYLKSAIGIKE